ncbi:tRNA wybutosine-synthesizing protein 5-like [Babylonia areolata]|uniref:tRNA wybutosine-synthesizing protein 5-like n=1 Tax=Babylonia areolata TaxID=304850 RepID=UPI003FD323DF
MTRRSADDKYVANLDIYDGVTKDMFLTEIYPKRRPAILRGVEIGECREKWTVDYMAARGGCGEVKVHVAGNPQMDFIHKNFLYRSLPFSDFVRRAAEEKHTDFFIDEKEVYYLRALGEDPRKDIADIRQQFPELAKDIVFPDFFEPEQFFSSVFRIASRGLQLWTHYDVMDNLLIQVTGKKRVVLFSPQEAEKLYLEGDKSSVLDIDQPDLHRFPLFGEALRVEGRLQPGDILFIPALWFHNVVSEEFGVAVNVFWKNLPAELYDHKDTYGNRDLVPAQRAMQIVDGALKGLEKLPPEYRDFYARRLVLRIKSKAYCKDGDV